MPCLHTQAAHRPYYLCSSLNQHQVMLTSNITAYLTLSALTTRVFQPFQPAEPTLLCVLETLETVVGEIPRRRSLVSEILQPAHGTPATVLRLKSQRWRVLFIFLFDVNLNYSSWPLDLWLIDKEWSAVPSCSQPKVYFPLRAHPTRFIPLIRQCFANANNHHLLLIK